MISESPLYSYLNVFRIAFLAFVSYLLGGRPVSRQSLRIRKLSIIPFRAQDITYEAILYVNTARFSLKFICGSVSLKLHLPTASYPRWLTFDATDIFFTSTTCDISTATIQATAWVFPKLLAQTAGPWLSVELDGLRIRIFRSVQTPYFIQLLRKYVVRAILATDIIRLDDFWSNVQFAGFTEHAPNPAAKGNGSADARAFEDEDAINNEEDDWRHREKREAFLEGRAHTEAEAGYDLKDSVVQVAARGRQDLLLPVYPHQTDELRVSALVRTLMIDTHEGRVLAFERIDAQMRRDWDSDHGTFVMVAENARWVKVPFAYQRAYGGFWTQLGTSLMQFPLDLVHSLQYPMTTVNLLVPRTDVTFDEFRIRDAEMLKQAFAILREKSHNSDMQLCDFLLDFALATFLHR